MRHFDRTALAIGALLALSLVSCEKSKTPPPQAAAPAVITFTKAALYPEGIDYDANGKRFLVTSLHEGIIGAVSDDGKYQVFAQDPKMVSAIGIRIDAARDRVLVCNSDAGASIHTKKESQGKLAGLAAFQLSTGKLINYVDLAKVGGTGGHFCNDIAVDGTGNAYVTDSFSPIIYKVDPNYTASVLITDKAFTGPSFNLNGIVVKDNFLLVVKMNSGQLFKIPLDNPKAFTEVSLPQKLDGSDGLLWGSDGSLIVIANNNAHIGIKASKDPLNAVFRLTSNDNWKTATISGKASTGDVFATTGVMRDGKIYVLYAMLHVLFNPETKTHVEKFEIHQQKL